MDHEAEAIVVGEQREWVGGNKESVEEIGLEEQGKQSISENLMKPITS